MMVRMLTCLRLVWYGMLLQWEALREATDEEMERDPTVSTEHWAAIAFHFPLVWSAVA
jgi:hypothetical protein